MRDDARDDGALSERSGSASRVRRGITSRRGALLGLAGALGAAAVSVSLAPGHAAPRARLIDERWSRFGDDGFGPDHRVWTDFLDHYRRVDPQGVARVAYGAVSEEHRAALQGYLAALQSHEPTTMTRDAAFAYWVNLYNAATVSLVLSEYPVDSIREVRGGLFNLGPWDDDIVVVEGERLSLDDVEHGILRPIWRDPRIHYAVNCAAVGCPNLAATAYEGEELDATLDAAARSYVGDPRGVTVVDGRLVVSSIYHWFKEDFGGADAGVIAHLRQYANGELAAALEGVSRIADHTYDWTLNDAA